MFGSFGMMELLLILVIVLIVFGAGRLPQLGEGLGKAIKGFKKSVHDAEAIEGSVEQPPPTQAAPPSRAPGETRTEGAGSSHPQGAAEPRESPPPEPPRPQ